MFGAALTAEFAAALAVFPFGAVLVGQQLEPRHLDGALVFVDGD